MKLDTTPCPGCGITGSLNPDEILACAPIGTYAIAGAQVKVSAYPRPRLTCGRCGWTVTGEYGSDDHDPVTYLFDPKAFRKIRKRGETRHERTDHRWPV